MTVSLKELLEQRAALDAKINEQRKTEQSAAVQKVRQLVVEYGLTSADIFARTRGSKAGTGETRTVPPKYRDPATGQTWTGRGKAPKWIEGQEREKFAI